MCKSAFKRMFINLYSLMAIKAITIFVYIRSCTFSRTATNCKTKIKLKLLTIIHFLMCTQVICRHRPFPSLLKALYNFSFFYYFFLQHLFMTNLL